MISPEKDHGTNNTVLSTPEKQREVITVTQEKEGVEKERELIQSDTKAIERVEESVKKVGSYLIQIKH